MDAVASHCEVLRPVGRDGLEMAGRDSAAMLKRRPEPAGGRFPARRPSVPAYSCGRTQTVTERDTDKGPKQAADGIRFPPDSQASSMYSISGTAGGYCS